MRVAICIGAVLLSGKAAAEEAGTVGMVTEIRNGRGRVELRSSGAQDWRSAAPLQSLRAGDEVRATADAWGVIVLIGGQGSVRVDAAASPYTVSGPQPGGTRVQKAFGLLEVTVQFLASGAREVPTVSISTRGRGQAHRTSGPPVILSPRDGPVLADALEFEWLGSRFEQYAVKIAGPGGTLVERAGVPGGRFAYPAAAPPLAPGTRYTFRVIATGHPAQEASFEVLDPARGQEIQQDLAVLDQALGPSPSPNTLAALRAAYLVSRGLLHDARLHLLGAIAKDLDEPTLYGLLGNIYRATGLPEQAEDEYDQVLFLLGGGAPGSAGNNP